MPEVAFEQAMKLSKSDPYPCILSMEAIGKDALKRNDGAMVKKAFLAAAEVDRRFSGEYTYHIAAMGIKLDRPLDVIVGVVTQNGPIRHALREIRQWLARKGRVEEAYQFAATHLPGESELQNHQQIGYACAAVRQYDYYAKHDYLGQAIDVINKMPVGKERDKLIGILVANFLYKVRGEVSPRPSLT